MQVTDKIAEILGEAPNNEATYSGDTPRNRLFEAFNDAGIECEVGDFLYGMTRILKPDRVLETGTHQGMSTLYIGYALQANKQGIVDTLEFIPEHYQTADQTFKRAGLTEYINNMQGDVRKFIPEQNTMYDMILLDTEPQFRFQELVRFEQYLQQGGFLFIHDLHRHMGQRPNEEHGFAWPWGKIPAFMSAEITEGRLRPFHFNTPRGLTGFYKVHEGDFYVDAVKKPSPNSWNI